MARSRLAAHLNDGEQRVRAELAIEERVPRVLCDHAPRREHGNAAVLQLSLAVPGKVQLRVNSCPPHTGSCTWTWTCARTLLCSAPVPNSTLRHTRACCKYDAPCPPPVYWVQCLHGHFFIVSGLASLEKPSGSKYARGAQSPIRPPTFICTATLLDAGRTSTGVGAKAVTLRANGAHVRSRSRLLLAAVEL